MSSPEAIATVTATLQRLLTGVVSGGTGVTTKPPSTARNDTMEQLNIFLYLVSLKAYEVYIKRTSINSFASKFS